MPAKRMRADVWVSLHNVVEQEMERTGLSLNEVINIALTDYFGLTPKGRNTIEPSKVEQTKSEVNFLDINVENDDDDDDDYI